MRIARRLFVVLLANNDHGKTTILKALVSQGGDPQFD
jgi:ABC-type cobalamin/Fe3+-siderophores transport system ATPase subunit